MRVIISICGFAVSYALIKYREQAGDMFGEAEWMRKIGGVHLVMVYLGIFVFFWSVAYLTNTIDFFLAPVLGLFPRMGGGGQVF